jgi:hypothetical protein
MRYELYKEGPLYAETPLIKELPKDDLTRMLAVQPSFYGSSSMVFGIPNAGGYDSLVPTRITRLWRVVEGGSTEAVVNQSPTGAFATTFSIKSRFDLLPRLAINHLVTAPMPPVLGCKGAASESTALKLEKPISSAELSPLVGDWNGDGLDSIGFYDPGTSTFYLQNIEGGYSAVQFGSPGAGWLPLAGDWNGDRRDSPGLYDRGTSTFYFSDAKQLQYGPPGTSWIPIAGDWNADGSDTVGLYDPDKSEFHLKNPPKNRPEDDLVFTFGKSGEGWIPLAGDWNGDGMKARFISET